MAGMRATATTLQDLLKLESRTSNEAIRAQLGRSITKMILNKNKLSMCQPQESSRDEELQLHITALQSLLQSLSPAEVHRLGIILEASCRQAGSGRVSCSNSSTTYCRELLQACCTHLQRLTDELERSINSVIQDSYSINTVLLVGTCYPGFESLPSSLTRTLKGTRLQLHGAYMIVSHSDLFIVCGPKLPRQLEEIFVKCQITQHLI